MLIIPRIDTPIALHHTYMSRHRTAEDFSKRCRQGRFCGAFVQRANRNTNPLLCLGVAFQPSVSSATNRKCSYCNRYAKAFDRLCRSFQPQRHSGHLFNNRYKSILCQEDTYLMELVRYIHLNPLRAGLVDSTRALDTYGYSGHSVLMGRKKTEWQDVDKVLGMFGRRVSSAMKRYRDFIEKGIEMGRRPDLVGGGFIRSTGGWQAGKALRNLKIHLKGDELILGNSDFVLHLRGERGLQTN